MYISKMSAKQATIDRYLKYLIDYYSNRKVINGEDRELRKNVEYHEFVQAFDALEDAIRAGADTFDPYAICNWYSADLKIFITLMSEYFKYNFELKNGLFDLSDFRDKSKPFQKWIEGTVSSQLDQEIKEAEDTLEKLKAQKAKAIDDKKNRFDELLKRIEAREDSIQAADFQPDELEVFVRYVSNTLNIKISAVTEEGCTILKRQ